MRILLTVHQFLPDYSTGTEILTLQVATELQRRGHNVRILTGYPVSSHPPKDEPFDRYEYRGLQIERYFHKEGVPLESQENVAEIEYNNHLVSDWLESFIDEWEPEVVHFFHLKNLSASPVDLFNGRNIPMLLTPTDFWFFCRTTQLLLPDGTLCKGPDINGVNCLRHAVTNTQSAMVSQLFSVMPDRLISALLRLSSSTILRQRAPFSWACALAKRSEFLRDRARSLDLVLPPTRFMEKALTDNGIRPKEMTLCRFGIDLRAFGSDSEQRQSVKELRVGFIGSLSASKGAHVLVDAMRQVSNSLPVKLFIYGNPSTHPEYSRRLLADIAKDPRVEFRGTFPNETIGRVFEDFDLLVVPSLWYENTPLVMYSAQAAGCPIIASNLPGMAEIVRDGHDGFLFGAGDSGELASVIKRLCRDREVLRRITENVQKPRSIEEYTDDLESAYLRLSERRQAAT